MIVIVFVLFDFLCISRISYPDQHLSPWTLVISKISYPDQHLSPWTLVISRISYLDQHLYQKRAVLSHNTKYQLGWYVFLNGHLAIIKTIYPDHHLYQKRALCKINYLVQHAFQWELVITEISWFMVFNATFNNISVIPWQSVL
jgi:hypothetical protein